MRRRAPDLVLDFDGTIVRPDTIRLLADLGMGPLRSRQLAREVDRGRVTVRDAVDRMVASVTTTPEIAFGFLEARARLDPGFPRLLDWAGRAGVGVTIVSAGLLPVVRRFLGPLADGFEVLANDLVVESGPAGHRWRVGFRGDDPAEVVKRRAVEARAGRGCPVVYVGDGRGDLEAAALAARIGGGGAAFARDALAEAMRAAGLPFTPFDSLDDVRRALAGEWAREPPESC
jgi:HAD superfamily phosphoserine phosphatase-like hydrolase